MEMMKVTLLIGTPAARHNRRFIFLKQGNVGGGLNFAPSKSSS